MSAEVAKGVWLLLSRHSVVGGDIFDLLIVATMLASGIHTIYTFNRSDFDMFPEITVSTP